MLVGRLRVEVLTEGVHSGAAGGVVPSSFRILRRLLDRIEDPDTGRVLVDELWCTVPDERQAQIDATADEIMAGLAFPFAGEHRARRPLRRPSSSGRGPGSRPSPTSPSTASHQPDRAGNVLRPFTELVIAARLAPTADPDAAAAALDRTPHRRPAARCHGHVRGRRRRVRLERAADRRRGCRTRSTRPPSSASGRPSSAMGEGGTIPFMAMLGDRFPDAQFLITGVLGPGSNAHGPNEFLHLPMARAVSTVGVGHVLDAHARR